ncbi:TldD/PmbA family protein [Methylocystis parvus]|uniref:TldD/PmbA family protein n=1 Tax=Methylocystis parvus TaxID=134 RepID=A0A6B8LXX4_9HYPH|nr:metallopeptidase TldD-related protein [Methylocystis parvus]QGM96294.1 TldD/PmbA family protein [Methylocystis parvus]WBJ99868.1 TldD/PmbA family protein [Methylocystis parvus OBBP]
MFLSSDDVKSIAKKIIAGSNADACVVKIDGGEDYSLRFARGGATTNIATSETTVRVSSHIGGRVGSVTTASIDETALAAARARSEEIARMLPVDPDYVAPLGPQEYDASARYDDNAASLKLDTLAAQAGRVIEEGARRNVDTFGCASSTRRFEALATSNGLFAYERRSEIDLSATARNKSDTWSGWAGAHEFFGARLDAETIAARACAKAAYNVDPVDLEPGDYAVILEPVAVAELAFWVMMAMDARAADEGRSFFARPGGGALIGEKLFDEKFTIRVDPADPLAPEGGVGWEGVPHRARAFIDRGAASTLYRSRSWARKTDAEPVPAARNFIVEGGETSLDDLIRSVKRGVLVTRIWYENMVEPKSLLLTGLTRDGNFLIENGRVTAPVRNMRFNQRLGELFANIAALGKTERVWRAVGGGAAAAPPMLAEKFHFSSKSSGI